jgi:hypothetical protein
MGIGGAGGRQWYTCGCVPDRRVKVVRRSVAEIGAGRVATRAVRPMANRSGLEGTVVGLWPTLDEATGRRDIG